MMEDLVSFCRSRLECNSVDIKQTLCDKMIDSASPESEVFESNTNTTTTLEMPSFLSKLGVRLSYLENFIIECGGEISLIEWSSFDVYEKCIIPKLLDGKLSFCDQYHGPHSNNFDNPTWYIHYNREISFVKVVQAISATLTDLLGDEQKNDTYVWFDIFSCPPELSEVLSYSYSSDIYVDTISGIEKILVVMHPLGAISNEQSIRLLASLFQARCKASTSDSLMLELALTKCDLNSLEYDLIFQKGKHFYGIISEIDNFNYDCDTSNSLKNCFECYLERFVRARISKIQHELMTLDTQTNILCEEKAKQLSTWRDVLITFYLLKLNIDDVEKNYSFRLEENIRYLEVDHPETVATINKFSRFYRSQGKYELALPLYEERLASRKRLLRFDHPYVYSAMQDLAGLHRCLENFDSAEKLLLSCLEFRLGALGSQHPDTISTLRDLGDMYRGLGKEALLEELLLSRINTIIKSFGNEHSLAANAVYDLAKHFEDRFLFAEAREKYYLCYDLRCGALGQSHNDTLEALVDVCRMDISTNQFCSAETLTKLCVDGYNRLSMSIETSNALDYTTCQSMLTTVYMRNKEYLKAEESCKQHLESISYAKGASSIELLPALFQLASIYRCEGKLDNALKYMKLYLDISDSRTLNSAPLKSRVIIESLSAIRQYVTVLSSMSKFEEAEIWFRKAIDISEAYFGKANASTLSFVRDLGNLYCSFGLYDQAEKHYMQCLEICTGDNCNSARSIGNSDGINNTVTNSVRDVIGTDEDMSLEFSVRKQFAGLYRAQAKYAEANSIYQGLISDSVATLGNYHPSVLEFRRLLANMRISETKYDEALDLYNNCFVQSQIIFGQQNAFAALVLGDIACVYSLLGQYDKAEKALITRYEMTQTVLDGDHPDTLVALDDLICMYEGNRHDGEGSAHSKSMIQLHVLYTEKLKIFRRVYGFHDDQTTKICYKLIAVKDYLKAYTDNLLLYNELLEMSKSTNGECHSVTIRIIDKIIDIHTKLQEFDNVEILLLQKLELFKGCTSNFQGAEDFDEVEMHLIRIYSEQLQCDKLEVRFSDRLTRLRSSEFYGHKHEKTFETMHMLGTLYLHQKQFELAAPLLLESLNGRVEILGESHEATIESSNAVAQYYAESGIPDPDMKKKRKKKNTTMT